MRPSPEIPASRASEYRPAALGALGVFGALCAAVAVYDPRYTQLALYGLYAIPAHLLISFLSNEIALWYAARLYPALLVAAVGTAATVVAILLDYWLIGWMVNHHLVRPVMEGSRFFRFAQRVFKKAPFLLIVGSAAAPVPFYPVKIIAIASDYSIARFIPALVLGRMPRFWFLATVGGQVPAQNSTLIWIMLGMALFSAWRIVKARKQRMLALADDADDTPPSDG